MDSLIQRVTDAIYSFRSEHGYDPDALAFGPEEISVVSDEVKKHRANWYMWNEIAEQASDGVKVYGLPVYAISIEGVHALEEAPLNKAIATRPQ